MIEMCKLHTCSSEIVDTSVDTGLSVGVEIRINTGVDIGLSVGIEIRIKRMRGTMPRLRRFTKSRFEAQAQSSKPSVPLYMIYVGADTEEEADINLACVCICFMF